jgi:hypothetical protein
MITMVRRTLAGAVISGVGAVSAVWLTALGAEIATAQADSRCDPVCHGTWCPGDPITYQITALSASWDPNVCHEFHQVAGQPGVYAEGPLPAGTFVCPPIAFMCP